MAQEAVFRGPEAPLQGAQSSALPSADLQCPLPGTTRRTGLLRRSVCMLPHAPPPPRPPSTVLSHLTSPLLTARPSHSEMWPWRACAQLTEPEMANWLNEELEFLLWQGALARQSSGGMATAVVMACVYTAHPSNQRVTETNSLTATL